MFIKLSKKIKFNLKGKRGIKGQIFPFLVLIMVIIIIAVMAFVNVAQVNTQKLSTMNAADAAALAGAAQLASTANTIADLNAGPGGLTQTFAWYGGLLALPHPLHEAWWGVDLKFYGVYLSLANFALAQYLGLLTAGLAGVQQDAGAATTTAFANMPIEEAQQRVGSPTGEAKVPSRFSEWLQDRNFYSDDNPEEHTYEWSSYYYNITENRQMQRPEKDYVKVKVKKPPENALVLIPVPAIPVPELYLWFVPPCLVVDACAAYDEAIIHVALANIKLRNEHPPWAAGTLQTTLLSSAIYTGIVQGVTTPATIMQTLLTIAAFIPQLSSWALQPVWQIAGPPGINLSLVLYWVPVPFIAFIQNNNAEVSVEVTRFSPTRDLGLWQFKERRITSGARARMRDGSAFNANYHVELSSVWDGEQI